MHTKLQFLPCKCLQAEKAGVHIPVSQQSFVHYQISKVTQLIILDVYILARVQVVFGKCIAMIFGPGLAESSQIIHGAKESGWGRD